ncbi:MAG: MazG nucleotide pyrophosphohydrolase domain-containing protein [Bacilli bacterium]|nr:MazG nucleotide pyrophosphohydrolase domain-containing protein [Bacilli bacterium]
MKLELKERLELFDETSSLKDIQTYIKDMTKERNFNGGTIENKMMLLVEEVGELAKAIRIDIKDGVDSSKIYDTSVEEELADVFIYLLDIANRHHIDLLTALQNKERRNCKREWK